MTEKGFWDYYDEHEAVYYSTQLQHNKEHKISFIPDHIKVVCDKNKHSGQNVSIPCYVHTLHLKDEILRNEKIELMLPRKTFIKMLRSSETDFKQWKNKQVTLSFKVLSMYRYDLSRVE